MTDWTFKTYRVEWLSETGYVDQYGISFKPDYSQGFPTREEAEADLKTRATYNKRLSRWETGRDYYEGQISYREVLVSSGKETP